MNTSHNDYDIVLINPDALLLNGKYMSNVGLASIEAYLKRSGIRCRTAHISEIDKYVDQADVFGLSVMDHTHAVSKMLTERLHLKTLIWGGWTATALPEFILEQNPGVDYVILQEGEERLLNLLRSFEQPNLFDHLDGIAYRNEAKEIIVRPPKGFINLDELPIPTDLAILNDLVFVELARGCYGGCGYCQENHRMRFKSANKAATEIEHWYAEGYRHFYIGDANSVANGELLGELIREMEERKLSINVLLSGRPNDVLRNSAVLEAIFRSSYIHLHSIEVGVEANTQHALDLLGRRSTPELNRQALTALLDLRAKYSPPTQIHANVILFSHFDMTLEDLVENVRFVGDFRCSRDVMGLQLYGVANTAVWHEMKARGFVPQEDRGLQIVDYPFTDRDVDLLFEKLVRAPRRQQKRKKRHTILDQVEFQHQCHDRILEFHHSPDIMESVLSLLRSTEASAS